MRKRVVNAAGKSAIGLIADQLDLIAVPCYEINRVIRRIVVDNEKLHIGRRRKQRIDTGFQVSRRNSS